jgi:predicted nucleic acid-binding protein
LAAIAIADTGPLYGALDRRDPNHQACAEVLQRGDLRVIVPLPVVSEVCWAVERQLGPSVEAAFLRSAAVQPAAVQLDIEAPIPEDWLRMAELVDQYADFPLGAVDASVVAVAERLGASTVLTIDQRHFRAIRPKHVDAFELLP